MVHLQFTAAKQIHTTALEIVFVCFSHNVLTTWLH